MPEDLAGILDLDGQDGPPTGRLLQIIEVACRQFANRGFDGVSMRDIAEECGISKATLYHYFPDKDSILRPLLVGVTRSIYQHVERHDDPARPPLERLRTFLIETARFFETFRWAWIAGSTVFWSDPKVRTRKERIAWRDRYEAMLRGILEQAMADGAIRPMDVKLAGRFVLGSLNWMPRWYRPDGPMTAPEIAAEFCDMILQGLQPRAPEPAPRRTQPLARGKTAD
ncbi:TetR/AcrR family transcriptional regulator [Muricoccus radiodurans]|uniref:TetR/AcrR family transcriptional regulator n=1 Tax=Muricoccus radiodurans TaxID=2231721 RepID=UPI003CF35155